MRQAEIDQISDAFHDAWEEFFGQKMSYIKYLGTSSSYSKLYNESKHKVYDTENKIDFYGSIKYSPTKKEIELAGSDENINAIVTLVTKELIDKGINNIEFEDLIEIEDRFGEVKTYSINSISKKVQFSNNFIFTKVGVNEYE